MTQQTGKCEYVYVLTNPGMPGLVKIGFSIYDPNHRAQALSDWTGVPAPFEVAAFCTTKVNHAQSVETAVHRVLSDRRPNKLREFFSIEPEAAHEVITEVASELNALHIPSSSDDSNTAAEIEIETKDELDPNQEILERYWKIQEGYRPPSFANNVVDLGPEGERKGSSDIQQISIPGPTERIGSSTANVSSRSSQFWGWFHIIFWPICLIFFMWMKSPCC